MIFFLHGFLGAPQDWSEVVAYLSPQWTCKAVDLLEEIPKTFPQDSVVVGYSMGGRIAMKIGHKGALVLIGAHFGLGSEEERLKRAKEEHEILQALKDCPQTFLEAWYAQPLFASLPMQGPLLQRRKAIDFAKHAELFSRFSLSKQPLYKPPPDALFLYGEKDKKYQNLYYPLSNAKAVPHSGHAAHIENPKDTAELIHSYATTFTKRQLARDKNF